MEYLDDIEADLVVREEDAPVLTLVCEGVPLTLSTREWWERFSYGKSGATTQRLSPADVVRLRWLYHVEEKGTAALAHRFGVSRRQVFRIIWGDCYPEVPMPKTLRPGPARKKRFGF